MWEDDPENWKRAFKSAPPNTVKVVHSIYWEHPYIIFYDAGWAFQLKVSDEYKRRLTSSHGIAKVHPEDRIDLLESPVFSKTLWYIKKPLDKYDVWISIDPDTYYRIFIDKETGDVFISFHG
jgi:hypothetical protein